MERDPLRDLGKTSVFVCSSVQVDPGHAYSSLTLSSSAPFSVFFLSPRYIQETYRTVRKHFCLDSLHIFLLESCHFPRPVVCPSGCPKLPGRAQKPFSGNHRLLAFLATLLIHQVWGICSSLWLRLEGKTPCFSSWRVLPNLLLTPQFLL